MKEKLRIGVLLNDFNIPSWKSQIITSILDSGFAEIVVVIKDNSIYGQKSEKKGWLAFGLLKLIERTDRLLFKTRVDFKQKKDISGLLKNIHTLEIDHCNQLNGNGIAKSYPVEIKDHNPDIILALEYCNPEGDILKIPKYGIWSYTHDSLRNKNPMGAGFWEVIKSMPVTNSRLEILTDKTESRVLFNSFESTCRYSININREGLMWRAALFAPRIMRGLQEYGPDHLDNLINRFAGNTDDIKVPRISPGVAAASLTKYLKALTKSIIKKLLFTDAFRWNLMFNINENVQLNTSDYGSFKKLQSPKGIFWADPFVVAVDDGYLIFVEEFIYKKDKAHLSVLKLDKKGNFMSSKKIIERPYHMSYPSVFSIDDTYYMIPETSKNKTIQLFKCVEFPYKWEFHCNIMENISAVDSTLFHFNTKWWLFTAVDQTANISGCSVELFLFFTDNIFSGKWESHPLNPIVSDIRSARPAGNLFVKEGKIYRPSQNCSGRYGIGFNINQITLLTEDNYEEILIREVKPGWDKKLKGTHTLNSDKDFTVIDAYSFRYRFSV